jgi:mono/diheme cytochrome c family protein
MVGIVRRVISAQLCGPVAATVLVLSSAIAAHAADPPGDTANGRAVARTWCAHCHNVERGETRQRADGLASFTALANDPRQTPERLRAFLARPHGRMPDLNLSRQDRDDLIAYFLSLREGRATPSTEPRPPRQ